MFVEDTHHGDANTPQIDLKTWCNSNQNPNFDWGLFLDFCEGVKGQ